MYEMVWGERVGGGGVWVGIVVVKGCRDVGGGMEGRVVWGKWKLEGGMWREWVLG